ncbi:hypothetical protein [Burkholderia multivorans]|nr:hypothetical protein [Burkholderia multivorans]PRE50287.1 hypothetical protein C6P97_12145 [Burkholderia multivorans]
MNRPELSLEQRLEVMLRHNIPQRLLYLRSAKKISDLEQLHHPLSEMTISIEGVSEPVYRDRFVAFSGPVLLMAVVHCRFLLEFVGLKVKGTPPVLATATRRPSDIGIEHFKNPQGESLKLASPSIAGDLGNETDVAQAWATVITVANQRIAHSTDSAKLDDVDHTAVSDAINMALTTVPELVCRKLYDAMSETRPI